MNLGDQFEKKTAGYLKGTFHQVVSDDPSNKNPRHARILFAAFPDGYSLKPFASCEKVMTEDMTPSEAGSYLSNYPDVTVQENLTGRLIEMNSYPATAEQIKELLNKGLIQAPCKAIKEQFPEIFG